MKGSHVEDIDCSLIVRPTRTALDLTFFEEVRRTYLIETRCNVRTFCLKRYDVLVPATTFVGKPLDRFQMQVFDCRHPVPDASRQRLASWHVCCCPSDTRGQRNRLIDPNRNHTRRVHGVSQLSSVYPTFTGTLAYTRTAAVAWVP